ncbi:hypothetical protein GOBAR_DD11916 [Gossypium barbadense]|nr:hypothetical protein GOBAR_DD11916 [Gossypium barbadense]
MDVSYPGTAYYQSNRGDDMEDMNFIYGKMNQPPNTQRNRRSNDEVNDDSDEEDDRNEADLWKKRSIFFELPLFDGTEEFREAPSQTSGSEILFMLEDMNFIYGKMNQPPNTQRNRRSNDEVNDDSDEEDDRNEADFEYKQILRSRSRSRRTQHRDINKLFTESFYEWLSQTVWSGKNINDEVKWLSQDKMPRRKILRGSIVQNDPNSTETNSSEQQTAIGSSNVPITSDDPIEVQTENGGTRRGRGRTLLRELYELDPVERIKVVRNSFG